MIEAWLILHRGHEFRLLSETFLDEVDPECRFSEIDTSKMKV